MMQLIVSDGQSLADIAVQAYGDVARVFELADTNGLAITDRLAPGQVLLLNPAHVANPQIVAYLTARAVVVNNDAQTIEAVPDPDPEPTDTDFHHPDFHTPDFH